MRRALWAMLLVALGALAGAPDAHERDATPWHGVAAAAAEPAPVEAKRSVPWPANARPDLAERWVDAKGWYIFPPNDGFAGEPRDETLAPSTKIDRYGQPGGRFLAPTGTSYEARALPYDKTKMDYYRYEVIKPLTVKAGTTIPWFDQSGGGIQYKTDRPVQQLIDEGHLREVQ